MRRRLMPLLLLGLLGLVGVSGAVFASSGSPPPGWGVAIEVPGTATLNHGNGGNVGSVSCATAGNCAAGGEYFAGSDDGQAFVVDETNGSWGNAIEVPGTASLNHGGTASVTSVSCATAGNCTAGGFYTDSSDHDQAFVVDERNGSWRNAIEVPGTAALSHGHGAGVGSVSCATAGNCTAGGSYTDGLGNQQAFVVDETNGTWGTAIEVPGTATLNSGGDAHVSSVSCATAGNCTAGGTYNDDSGHAFVVDETNGSWGNAIEVPGMATLNSGGDAGVISVSCATAGNCAAGGSYADASSRRQAFVADETNGSWGNAIEVPGSATLNTGASDILGADVRSISCAAAGECAAGGESAPTYGHVQAFLVDETNGTWGKAIEVRGTAPLKSGDTEAWVNSVSCATAGACTAGGAFWRAGFGQAAFLVDETNGTWAPAVLVPGTAAREHRGALVEPSVDSVSCATAANCAAGGSYHHGSGYGVFVVNSTPSLSLNARGTNCNGAYAGTGGHVFVPTGGRCTLLPGTHVTGSVTVSNGGTLYATGVRIDGFLRIAGSATVCQSRIHGDVKAVSAGGAVNLGGGPGCMRGDAFLHDVVVSHDSHNVWIWGNHVAGNLIVLDGHGKTEWIFANTVANLLVAHSGPVVVAHNHAKGNLRCTANKPQHGHGNRARGTNTCPK